MKAFKSLILVSTMLLGVGCTNTTSPKDAVLNIKSKLFGVTQVDNAIDLKSETIKVVDEFDQPVSNAQVLIGNSLNDPFQNNFLTADKSGEFKAPSSWVGPLAVTVSATGFVRATYLAQYPEGQVFRLRHEDTNQKFELNGQNQGFDIKNGDGNADFSIVIPMLQRSDLLHFNMDLLISPTLEHITVAGTDVEVPSNVILPKQKENYIIPIVLEKPNYKITFDKPGVKKIFASRGQFPFKKMVKAMKDGVPFVDLINDFTFYGGGIRETNVANQNQSLDIPVNEISFNEKYDVQNQQTLPNEVLLGAAVAEHEGVFYYPTDIRNLAVGGKDSLSVISNANPHIVSVLKRKNEISELAGKDRLSAVVLPFTKGIAPKHLQLMENPRLVDSHHITIQDVKAVDGVSMMATYATRSQVTVITATVYKQQMEGEISQPPKITQTEVKHDNWEVFGNGWVKDLVIPKWPGEVEVESSGNLKNRWSVALIGSTMQTKVVLGPELMQSLTHVTNSSVDF